MILRKAIVLLLPLAGMLSACSAGQQATYMEGFTLGTVYNITLKGPVPEGLQESLDSLFAAADNSMSVFNPASLLSRINRNETDSLDTHIAYCVNLARGVSELSGGKYDITVLPLVEAFGFSGGKPAAEPDMDSLLAVVGYDKIAICNGRLIKENPGTRIDLNSVAKGYTVDLTARLLESRGVSEYLVDIGGEISCRGTNPRGRAWVVGIETPVEGNYIQGASLQRRIAVSDRGLATSGNYRNFRTDSLGRKFTHIVDPLTGSATSSNLLSATVVAESCALADAMGTMFIALGLDGSLEMLTRHPEIAALLIYADQNGDMLTYDSRAMKPYFVNNSM